MKAKALYILCLDETGYSRHPSVEPSAVALEAKYAKNLGEKNVTRLVLKVKHMPCSLKYQEPLGVDFEKELAAIRGSTEPDVGIYVVAHGDQSGNYQVGGLLAPQLAELIVAIGFPAVRKVCIEACHMQQPYLLVFCNELYQRTSSGSKLRPMVAGYRHFVTVVGSNAVKNATVYDVGGKDRVELKGDSPDHLGEKVIKSDTSGITGAWYGKTHNILLRSAGTPGSDNDATALKANKIVARHDGTTAVMLKLADYEKK